VLNNGLRMVVAALIWVSAMGLVATDVYPQEDSEVLKNPSQQEPKKARPSSRPRQYPAALAGFEVVADLTASPATYMGSCPALITFKGKITVNRPATLHYRFIRSDDTRKNPGVLTFDKPGTQEVMDTWELGKAGGSAELNGWSAIQISFPMKVQSNTAYFRGRCSEKDVQGSELMSPAPPPPPPRKAAPVRPSNPLSGLPKVSKEEPAKQPVTEN
jgi:hypothetical protein